MGASDVVFTISAQEASAVRAFLKIRAEAEKMGASFDFIDKKGKNAKQSIGMMAVGGLASLGKAAAGFAGVGSALAGIYTAAHLIFNEWNQYLARRQEAGAGVVSLAGPRSRLALALAGDPRMTAKQAEKEAFDIATKQGVSVGAAMDAIAGAVSSKGRAIDPREAVKATALASSLVAGGDTTSPQDLQGLARFIMALKRNFDGTLEQQAGMATAFQAEHAGVDISQTAQHTLPILGGLRARGLTEQQAMGSLGALSVRAGDAEGRITGNALAHFFEQIITSTQSVVKLKGKGAFERLDWLTSGDPESLGILNKLTGGMVGNEKDPEVRRQLRLLKRNKYDVEKMSLETKPKAFLMSALDPADPLGMRREMQEGAARLPKIEDAEKVYKDTVKEIQGNAIDITSRAQGQIRAQTLQEQVAEPGIAIKGVIIDEMDKYLRATGKTSMGSRIAKAMRAIQEDKDPGVVLENLAKEIQGEQTLIGGKKWIGVSPEGAPMYDWAEPTAAEKAQLKRMNEMKRDVMGLRKRWIESENPSAPAAKPGPNDQSRFDIHIHSHISDMYGREINRSVVNFPPAAVRRFNA